MPLGDAMNSNKNGRPCVWAVSGLCLFAAIAAAQAHRTERSGAAAD